MKSFSHFVTESSADGPIGLPELRRRASTMGANEFLHKHVAELMPEHMTHGIMPNKITHDVAHPHHLDPSEWDDWDEHETWTGNTMPESAAHIAKHVEHLKQGGTLPPVLVHGTTDHPTYNPTVVDGHHRTVAHQLAGKTSIGVNYDIGTLSGIWSKANGSSRKSSEIETEYRQHYLPSQAK